MALKRTATLADQLAHELRGAILRGDYETATPLPSETQLAQTFGVSRITVRAAVAALRAEGLITVSHGRGSFVRARPPREQLRRLAPDFATSPRDPERQPVPVLAYAPATADIAELLGIDHGAETIVREIRTTSGPTRFVVTSHLPAALAAGTPLDDPHLTIGDLDQALTKLGYPLAWTERVTARIPTPDERTAFGIQEGIPLLRATRITTDTRDNTPLETRITLLPADGIELEYPLSRP
jgi:GntR family transcriptional regulator